VSPIRLAAAACLFVTGLLVLVVRLWYVQIREGPNHAREIARQSIRRIRIAPVRGRIRASDGVLLVDNRPRFAAVLHVSEMRRPGLRERTVAYIKQEVDALARVLGRPSPVDERRIKRQLRVYPALPLEIFGDLNARELAVLSELRPRPPGLDIVCDVRRRYPHPGLASHILGFTGKRPPIPEGVLGRYRYTRPDLTGRSGLEKMYDHELAGRPGVRIVRVDTMGFVHEVLGEPVRARDGNDLILTLDTAAQSAAERVISGIHGAIVVLDVHSGAVLAMASSPAFDPAQLDATTYRALAADTRNRPLVNRALAAGYLPGSIVKPLVGLAALNAGVATPDEFVDCPGYYELGKKKIMCWDRYGHGPLDLLHAIEQSCNTYFLTMGLRAGLEALQSVYLAAGIGQDPEIDLPHSAAGAAGAFPDPGLLLRRTGRRWQTADTAYICIGQGPISVSPLQAAMFTAAIANGGLLYRPFLVKQIVSPEGVPLRTTAPRVLHRLPATPGRLDLIRRGMWLVVNGEHATAKTARTPVITLAGKTGTAEVIRDGRKTKDTWFVCFAPYESPRYAVALVVEDGVSGGHTAAPLVRRFFEEWLTARPPQLADAVQGR